MSVQEGCVIEYRKDYYAREKSEFLVCLSYLAEAGDQRRMILQDGNRLQL